MKKAFKYYAIIWAIIFVVFNVIAILLPWETTVGSVTYTKFAGSSLVTFIVFEVALILNLAATGYALMQKKLSGLFYRIPMITLSYGAVVVTLIVGCIAMAVPNLPSAVPLVLCIAVLLFYVIAIIAAQGGAAVIEAVDQKVAEKTAFIKQLTSNAETLQSYAGDDTAKALCRKVYEAVRYSDPMSSDALAEEEANITESFAKFESAVKAKNTDAAKDAAEEAIRFINIRNSKCRTLK